jgi:DNA helicase-2/ATP-dependent DNA helicase PcrA
MTIHAAKGLEFRAVFVVGLEENLFPSEMAIEEGGIEEERRLFYVAITRAAERLFLTWSHSRMSFGKFENNQRSRFVREIDPACLKKDNERRMLGTLMEEVVRPAVRRPAISERPQSTLFGRETPRTNRETFSSNREAPSFNRETLSSNRNAPSASIPQGRPLSPLASKQSSFTASAPLPAGQQVQVGNHIEHSRFGRGVVTAIEGTGLDTKAIVQFENAGTKQLLLRFARFTVVS